MINEWRILVRQWQTSCIQWRDKKRIQFERENWNEFERTVPRFLDKLGELNQLIEKSCREIDNLSSRS